MEFPPVVAFNSDTHEDGFDTKLPVAKFILDPNGLNTDGDLEFNMSAGISEYEELSLYLTNDFVSLKDGDSEEIFRANGDTYCLSPPDSENNLLWEEVDLANGIEAYEECNTDVDQCREYKPGDLVCYSDDVLVLSGCNGEGDTIFRATAFTQGVDPTEDSENTPLWLVLQPDSDNDIEYNPRRVYSSDSDIIRRRLAWVREEDAIYRVNHPEGEVVRAITPDLNQAQWDEIGEFVPNQSYPAGSVVKGTSSDSYYEAVVSTNGRFGPEDDEQHIWEK